MHIPTHNTSTYCIQQQPRSHSALSTRRFSGFWDWQNRRRFFKILGLAESAAVFTTATVNCRTSESFTPSRGPDGSDSATGRRPTKMRPQLPAVCSII